MPNARSEAERFYEDLIGRPARRRPRRAPSSDSRRTEPDIDVPGISAGRVFDGVQPGEPASSIGGVYDALIASRPEAVRGVVTGAEFWDVGTPADYWRTSNAFLAKEGAASPSIGRRARIDPAARVMRSILWDDVEVGPDAVIDECIVTDEVIVPAGATYRRAVLIRGADDQPLVSPLNLEPGPLSV